MSGSESGAQDADRLRNILSFWRDVEMLDINKVDGTRNKRDELDRPVVRNKRFSRGDPLPWDPDSADYLPDTDDHMWFHLVYGGIARQTDVVERVVEIVCPESELTEGDREIFSGTSWSFAMMLTSSGKPFRESFCVANHSVAANLAARNIDLSNLEVAVERITADFFVDNPDSNTSIHPPGAKSASSAPDTAQTSSQVAPDDGDDASGDQSQSWTIGEHAMDWALFESHLALRDRVLGTERAANSRDVCVISMRMDRPKAKPDGKIGFQKMPEWSVMNSFYLKGINRVLANLGTISGTALEAYLNEEVAPGLRKDLIKDPQEMARVAGPGAAPLGRWPSNPRHPLMFGQQAAVGEVVSTLSEDSGLVAVNGPPGTGKTTLLRDIIAHVVTSRALAISQLKRPEDIFERSYVETKDGMIRIPRPSVASGFGIVVASANNAAVDNISREIPLESSIDRGTFDKASYLETMASMVSDERTLYQIKNDLHPELACKPSWGLLGAALGRRSNVKNFFNKLLAFSPKGEAQEKPTGLFAELDQKARQMRRTGRSWLAIRRDFTQLAGKLADSRQALMREELEVDLELRSAARMIELQEEKSRLEKRLNTPRTSDREEHALAIRDRLEVLKSEIERLVWGDIEMGNDNVRKSVRLPDSTFFAQDHHTIHKQSIWSNEKYDQARSRLFALGLELIEATLVENRSAVCANLKHMQRAMTSPTGSGINRAGTRAMWDTLFMVVPVVSTTLASLSRNFENTGPGHIGWMLIDEAGQAAPQIVAEATWRARRAVIIGDPRQIEPVATTPAALVEALREKHGVAERYSPVKSSAQVVADQTMTRGSFIRVGDEDPVWTGIPLRAHRRCAEPMFSIANKIAYDGQMVQATPADRLSGEAIGGSCWFDVSGPRRNSGKVILEEIECLKSCIDVMADDWPEKDGVLSDIFIITPFRDVAGAIRRATHDMQAPGRIEAGTIHTFQGKEADVVFLVLGSAPGSAGRHSRTWAAQKPNILNVALTRARSRVHVIGSGADWAAHKSFDVLHETMADMGKLITLDGVTADDIRARVGSSVAEPVPS